MIIVTIRSLHFNWNINQVGIKTSKNVQKNIILAKRSGGKSWREKRDEVYHSFLDIYLTCRRLHRKQYTTNFFIIKNRKHKNKKVWFSNNVIHPVSCEAPYISYCQSQIRKSFKSTLLSKETYWICSFYSGHIGMLPLFLWDLVFCHKDVSHIVPT